MITIAHFDGAQVIPMHRDTHKDEHVVAIDRLGARLGEHRLRASPAGYMDLERWAVGMGDVATFGVEGTRSFGAGLARFLSVRGHTVIEVNRPDRFPTMSGQAWQERSHRCRSSPDASGCGRRSAGFTEVRDARRRDDPSPQGRKGLRAEGANPGHRPDEGAGRDRPC